MKKILLSLLFICLSANAQYVSLTKNVTGTLPVANGGTGITSIGTGVATAWGINVGSSGSMVVNGGALGTPSSGTATNLTGLPLTTGVTGTLPVSNGGTGVTSAQGNGSKAQLSTGATTTNDCVKFDANGNTVDAGAGCASGITLPTSGDIVVSNGTTSPAGLAPVNGDCVVGSGGAWTAGACAGAATAITVGTTTVGSGTTAYLLYNNGGTLGNEAASSIPFTTGTLSLAGNLSTSGAFAWAFTVPGAYTYTLPGATSTLDALGVAQTFTAAKTFTNSDLLLLGSSTGATTFTSANSSASNYTVTIPAATDTVVELAQTQVLSAKTMTTPTINGFTECADTPTITSGAVTLSNTTCTFHKLSFVASTTVTLPSPVAGQSFTVEVCYGGVYTLTWAGGGTLEWPAGTAPTATSVNGKCDFFTFFAHDTTYTYGQTLGLNYTGS